MIGFSISRYVVESKLGEGGMGVVYKAHDPQLARAVAIKVLPPEVIADPERKRRFVQEARAASALNHPNIVTVHDIGADGDRDYIVMEYLAGGTLDRRIPVTGLPSKQALRYAVAIADALAAAHQAGIIHRDLKPSNVLITEDGRVKVLDFGLAKLLESDASSERATTIAHPSAAWWPARRPTCRPSRPTTVRWTADRTSSASARCWIYYAGPNADGQCRIWKMPLAGGTPIQVTDTPLDAVLLETYDGRDLYYLEAGRRYARSSATTRRPGPGLAAAGSAPAAPAGEVAESRIVS